MTNTLVIIEMELPWAESLKGRRRILNSIKERLKKFNLSILDLSGEYPKEATIALSFLSPNEGEARRYLEKIDDFLYRNFPEITFHISHEML